MQGERERERKGGTGREGEKKGSKREDARKIKREGGREKEIKKRSVLRSRRVIWGRQQELGG
jgi:hypothetical protein